MPFTAGIDIKSGIRYDCYAKIKVDSYDLLAIEKTLTLHNVIIRIKSVPDKDQYHKYNILLEKCFCNIPSK